MSISISYDFSASGDEAEIRARFARLAERFRRLPVVSVAEPRFRVGFPSYRLLRVKEAEEQARSKREKASNRPNRSSRKRKAEVDDLLLFFRSPLNWDLPQDASAAPKVGSSPFSEERWKKRSEWGETIVEWKGDWAFFCDGPVRMILNRVRETWLGANTRAHALDVRVGEGCEPFTVRLARAGPGVKWKGAGCTKTQYAEHFVTCHLAVIRMLEMCEEEGIRVKVFDGGKFWATYNWELLAKILNEETAFISLMANAISGVLPVEVHEVSAPIRESANYLTVSGQPELPDWFLEGRTFRPRRKKR
ncbi:MAG: hypothetical protein HY719_12500 [Planctomycetes bacterium]|nr:hypothetical protein [Planctomycetota bacterium]